MNSSKSIDNVAKALTRSTHRGEKIVVVIDPQTETGVVDAVMAAAQRVGVTGSILRSPLSHAPNAEPAPEVSDAILEFDLIVLATSTPITHTLAIRRAIEAGGRVLVMDGITEDVLAQGAANADYDRMHALALAVEQRWNEASHVHVVSEFGMDFEADITGRQSWRWDGRPFRAKWFSLIGCAFPDGEVGIAPLEGSGNGTVAWDASVHGLGLLDEPIRLHVEEGFIDSIDGGQQGRQFAGRMAELRDKNSYYCPAEISIGINEAARITGAMREDKKALGTVHIACGTNADLGGTIEAKAHIDGVVRRPTLWMDGALVIENGRLLVEPTIPPESSRSGSPKRFQHKNHANVAKTRNELSLIAAQGEIW